MSALTDLNTAVAALTTQAAGVAAAASVPGMAPAAPVAPKS